ncbi:MAG: amidohydrolase family protein [Balneolaceae bacterium]
MKPFFTCAIFLLFAFSCSETEVDVSGAEIIIEDVNIVNIDGNDIQENQNVIIKEGRIDQIVSSSARFLSRSNSETTVIDGKDKYLLPGFWDNHVHFRGGEDLIEENKNLLPLFIVNGVTTVRDAGGDITPAILEWKNQIEAGELPGPDIFTSGPKLDGPEPGWAGSIELLSADEVPAALDSLEKLGVDYVKIYDSSITGDIFLAIVDEAEKRELPVSGHMPYSILFNETVERGLDATEHLYYVLKGSSSEEEEITEEIMRRQDTDNPLGFWTALDSVLETFDEEAARNTYRNMARHHTAAMPTLRIGGILSNLKNTDHSGDEYLNYIGPGIIETYNGRLQSALRASDEATENRLELQQKFISMVPEMHDAGVAILAGSDSGPYNTYVYPGISLHEELEALVDAGLSPAEALQTSAQNGAGFFGLESLYGKAEPGFIADLVLLDENPLDNIQNTRLIHAVILNGHQIYQREQLDHMLDGLEKLYNSTAGD